jgi:hypothetical protein
MGEVKQDKVEQQDLFRKTLIRELKVSEGRRLIQLAKEEHVSLEQARCIAHDVFTCLCRRAAADNVVTRSERRYLKRIARQLCLGGREWEGILKQICLKVVQRRELNSPSDGDFTHDEAVEIDELRQALGLPVRGISEKEPSPSGNQQQLTRIRRTMNICLGVLSFSCVLLIIAGIAIGLSDAPFSVPIQAAFLGVFVGGVAFPAALRLIKASDHSSLRKKLSMRNMVVHIVSRERTEDVAYSQTKYARDEYSTRVVDPGYCASTFYYDVVCERHGVVRVSRKLYFQLESGQYYQVRVSTADRLEVHKVIRMAPRAEFEETRTH